MKKIILDTNMLMVPGKFKIDIFQEISRLVEDEYKLVILDVVIDELKRISKKKNKDGKIAKLGLDLIKAKDMDVIKTDKTNTDKQILDISDKDTIVATNDIKLRTKLRNKGIKVLYLRGKNRLEII